MIKVNGAIINPEKIAMLDRKQFHGSISGGFSRQHSGVVVRFTGGGAMWIEDPDAQAVEQAFAEYDGVQSTDLPY